VESEYTREHQKDQDEHIGQRRGEVTAQLASENHRQLAHSASPRVRLRNTSSSRPRSTSSSFTAQPRWPIRALTCGKITRPGCASTVRLPSVWLTSTPATPGKAASATSSSGSSLISVTAW